MLDFMVIALPRSGSTWASVWLDCVHDPLHQVHYREWDAQPWRGVSCTGIHNWHEWVNDHPALKLILHRPQEEREASIQRLGYEDRYAEPDKMLQRIEGWHVPWTDMFDPRLAEPLWRYLRPDVPFDANRHARLVQTRIEPHVPSVRKDQHLLFRLGREFV